MQVNQVILYFYEQKKRSPYTSIREEHIKITVELPDKDKDKEKERDTFDLSKWYGKEQEIRFMISG